jgi:two-component system OmpR family response regulator
MGKILVIEDEWKVLEIVASYVRREGFEAITATTGKEGLNAFNEYKPDLVVLDLMLPDISGESVCQKIKEVRDIPVIMLTAKSNVEDRIAGLSLGADDYLVKPFSPRELMMRVKVVLKRYGKLKMKTDIVSFNQGRLVINKLAHEVMKEGVSVELTPVEYKLLVLFTENPSQSLSRDQIIDKVFGQDFEGFDRTVDAHVKNLRKKIEGDSKNPEFIRTIFGFGYRFEGDIDE